MSNWIDQNLIYPEKARNAGAKRDVIVYFTVSKSGIGAVSMDNSNEDLAYEAARLVWTMPKWKLKGSKKFAKLKLLIHFDPAHTYGGSPETLAESMSADNNIYTADQVDLNGNTWFFSSSHTEFYTERFLKKHLSVVEKVKEKGLNSNIDIEFVVEKNGQPSNIKAICYADSTLEKQICDIVSTMKWMPARAGGKLVRSAASLSLKDLKILSAQEKAAQDSLGGPIWDIYEQMPQFPGGNKAMSEWIKENIQYPAKAKEKGIQGRVILSFVVETNGTLSNFKIEKSVDPELDAEAIRVISSMPKWTPGKQSGTNVRVRYTTVVTFQL